jgi:hypothetical protein
MHRIAGARVAAIVRLVLADSETAQTTNFDPLATLERICHNIEDAVHDKLRSAFVILV